MKFCKRYLSVFVVFALLFGAFSIPAAAADSKQYKFTMGLKESSSTDTMEFYSGETVADYHQFSVVVDENTYVKPYIFIQSADGTLLAEKGKEVTFSVNNFLFYFNMSLSSHESYTSFIKKFDIVDFIVHYTDGTTSMMNYVLTTTYDTSKNRFTFSGKFTPSKDVKAITIQGTYTFYIRQGASLLNATLNSVTVATDVPGAQFSIQSEEAGLLSGLLNWVKDIFNKVGDIFDTVSSGFANIGTWFAELPGKLWAAISDGLKGLFVPDEQYIADNSDRWDELLSNRFGAVYQAGSLIVECWQDIKYSDTTDSISMPNVSLESAGIPFSFGGFDVKIVPDGFSVLVEVVKKLISISCVFLFVNGLRKRYDEIMGVEQ